MKNCKTPNFPKNTTNHTVIREIDENSIAAHNGVSNYIDQKVKYTPEGRNLNDFPQNDKSNKIFNGCFLYPPEKIGNSIVRPHRPRLPRNAAFLPPNSNFSENILSNSYKTQNFGVCNTDSIDSCLFVMNS